ncbi:MAG: sigma-54 dependent transcriptional regulator [Planctomycetaceae bacterium]
MPHLLIVDDEPSIGWGLTKLAGRMGLTATSSASAEDGLRSAQEQKPDAVLLDVRLPGMTGLEALPKFRQIVGAAPVVIITAYGDLETAVESVRQGAFEYLVKPFDLATVEQTIRRALRATAAPSTAPAAAAPEVDSADQLIGRSAAFQEVFKQIALVAPTSACVHLRGESGTGKELVARAIHRYSRRADQPFIPIHVASLSESLVESELFGHARGAFTGAENARKGLLELADGGTIFLDEVAEIPTAVQVKLLRTLEEGQIWPVGADQPRQANFRLISATHHNLQALATKGEFRHDLYFRLVTFQIDLPPLRERSEDIDALVEYFLDKVAVKNQIPRPTVTPEALAELKVRYFAGNVRELRNVIEHAAILARGGSIEPWHWPIPPSVPLNSSDDAATDLATAVSAWSGRQLALAQDGDELHLRLLREIEPVLFSAALKKSRGQVAAAARLLGLHRTTLKGKLDEYGLSTDGE